MENNIKVEGVIWKVAEGKITEVKINDDIFVKKISLNKTYPMVKPSLIEQPTDIDHDKETPFDEYEDIDRGEMLTKNIHRKVLNEVVQSVKEGKNPDDFRQIISKYHPNVTDESLITYTSNYKRYIIEHYPELKSNIPTRFKKEVNEKIEEIQRPKDDKRGKIIARLGHNTVFEWPLRAFKKALKEERDRSYLSGIILYYYDTNNRSSINTYLSCYKRYINKTYDENKLTEVSVFDENENLYKQLPPLETFLYKTIKDKDKQLPERYDDIKGQCIGYMGSNSIYENVLTDIKTAIIENKTKNKIIYNILKPYYPKVKKQSLTTYYRAYIRWIHQEEKSPVRALSFERKKKKPPVKPDYAVVGFDESYKRWISKDEIDKVKKAICHVELNYEPTTKNICDQTGLTEHCVRSTIHWMIDNNFVQMKYNENLIPLYTLMDLNGSGESII